MVWNSFVVFVVVWVVIGFPDGGIAPSRKYAQEITDSSLKENLSILASDAMEGRETGKRGQKMAAAFIRTYFEDLGLAGPVDGDYYQPIDLYATVAGETYIRSGDSHFRNFSDIVYYGDDSSNGEIEAQLVFVGNGTEAEFAQVGVKGKAVLVFYDGGGITANPAVTRARSKGATMVLFCPPKKDDYDRLLSQIRNVQVNRNLSLSKPAYQSGLRPGLFVVSPDIVDKLLGVPLDKLVGASTDSGKNAIKKIKPITIRYKASKEVKVVKSENVLGYLEGSDKKEELVVITAHYDHIGINNNGKGDHINNGADDDGSGTASVLEIAKAFATAKKEGNGPRRSILFMTVTGEEKGLLGSEYYSEHPVFPLEQTVVDLNIDMIGRRDAVHRESPPYLYLIGADKLSSTLNELSDSVNRANTKLIFDYTYNDQHHPDRFYYRSDHWNFAKNNIPIIFYFSGVHEDYHKPGDEVDKIEFDLLALRTKCIFYTAWEIANREERIKPDTK